LLAPEVEERKEGARRPARGRWRVHQVEVGGMGRGETGGGSMCGRCKRPRSIVFSSGPHGYIGGGGEMPFIEGMERGF
jgi:hypothetical protein